MKRIWLLLGLVVLIPVVPWLVVGAPMESWIAGALQQASASERHAWIAGLIGLGALAGDSFLPVPSTIVMSGLGWAFGVGLGGGLATLGLSLSGLIAYTACRLWGAKLATRIAGERGIERVRTAMTRLGPLTIAVTRSVPVIQEATSCLAGLSGMPFRLYLPALLAGCLPTGFAYAAIGATAVVSEKTAVILSLALPALTWPLVFMALKAKRTHQPG